MCDATAETVAQRLKVSMPLKTPASVSTDDSFPGTDAIEAGRDMFGSSVGGEDCGR